MESILIWFGARWADVRHNWKPKLKRVRLHLVAFGLFLLTIVEAADPYFIASILPERWAAIIPGAFGVIIWLLRKATANPPHVTTTYVAETATTEPHSYEDRMAAATGGVPDDYDGDHTHDDRVL